MEVPARSCRPATGRLLGKQALKRRSLLVGVEPDTVGEKNVPTAMRGRIRKSAKFSPSAKMPADECRRSSPAGSRQRGS